METEARVSPDALKINLPPHRMCWWLCLCSSQPEGPNTGILNSPSRRRLMSEGDHTPRDLHLLHLKIPIFPHLQILVTYNLFKGFLKTPTWCLLGTQSSDLARPKTDVNNQSTLHIYQYYYSYLLTVRKQKSL